MSRLFSLFFCVVRLAVAQDIALDLPLLKTLVLVDSPSKIKKQNYESGIYIEGITAPGGNDKLEQELLSQFYERPISDSLVFDLKQAIVSFYRHHNHPLVNVLDLQHDEHSETLSLVVIEARLGKVTVKGNEKIPSPAIEKWVRVKPGESIDASILRRDIRWLNSNPFREVNLIYRPGEKHGTTDIDLIVSERKSWSPHVGGDNTGSPMIGRTRWFAGVRLANLFWIDHDLMLQFTTCNDIQQFKAYTLQYAARLPWRNICSFFGTYSTTDADSLATHHSGTSYQMAGRYTIPQWFGQESFFEQFTYEIGFDFKGLNNNIFFVEDSPSLVKQQFAWIGQFTGSFHLTRNQLPHKMTAGIEAYWSPGPMLPHQTDLDFSSLRVHATPKYFYARAMISFAENLPKGWNLYLRAKAQLSSTILLSSEQFALGGMNTVRGYDERVVSGDNAFCTNFEIWAPFFPIAGHWKPKINDSLQILGFCDVGHTWNHERISDFPIGQWLLGIGPAIRYHVGSYFSLQSDLGFPLLNITDDSGRARLHFSALLSY